MTSEMIDRVISGLYSYANLAPLTATILAWPLDAERCCFESVSIWVDITIMYTITTQIITIG